MIHDAWWSMSSVLVFSLNGVAVFFAGRAGYLKRYEDVSQYGISWLILSLLLLIVLQDTYFYWTHRAMHHPRIFRSVHRVHHVSTNTSPFTAYAFSPIEAFVHAAFVPLVWAIVPLHELAVFAFMIFMVLRNVLGHLSIELFPRGFAKNAWWAWTTTFEEIARR
jgi:Delta7-sterol 5-desaturase